jgi:hypothetical protein
MSSVLRHFAQIPARIPYFVVTGTFDTEDPDLPLVEAPALDLSGATTIASLNTFVNEADMNTYFTQMTTSYNGRLLKDLGQEIIIVDSNNSYVARYRHVLLLNGAASEGVDAVPGTSFLVRVWAADGTNVEVARTG